MSTADQSPCGSYLNTDANTVSTRSKGTARNSRIINHNGNKRNNQPENRAPTNSTGEVTSVVSILGTVAEQRSTKDQFKTFWYKVK